MARRPRSLLPLAAAATALLLALLPAAAAEPYTYFDDSGNEVAGPQPSKPVTFSAAAALSRSRSVPGLKVRGEGAGAWRRCAASRERAPAAPVLSACLTRAASSSSNGGGGSSQRVLRVKCRLISRPACCLLTLPLQAKKVSLNGRTAYYQLPSGGAKGTLVIFHGCSHDGAGRGGGAQGAGAGAGAPARARA